MTGARGDATRCTSYGMYAFLDHPVKGEYCCAKCSVFNLISQCSRKSNPFLLQLIKLDLCTYIAEPQCLSLVTQGTISIAENTTLNYLFFPAFTLVLHTVKKSWIIFFPCDLHCSPLYLIFQNFFCLSEIICVFQKAMLL